MPSPAFVDFQLASSCLDSNPITRTELRCSASAVCITSAEQPWAVDTHQRIAYSIRPAGLTCVSLCDAPAFPLRSRPCTHRLHGSFLCMLHAPRSGMAFWIPGVRSMPVVVSAGTCEVVAWPLAPVRLLHGPWNPIGNAIRCNIIAGITAHMSSSNLLEPQILLALVLLPVCLSHVLLVIYNHASLVQLFVCTNVEDRQMTGLVTTGVCSPRAVKCMGILLLGAWGQSRHDCFTMCRSAYMGLHTHISRGLYFVNDCPTRLHARCQLIRGSIDRIAGRCTHLRGLPGSSAASCRAVAHQS